MPSSGDAEMNDENSVRKLEEDARDLMMRIQASETSAANDIAQLEADAVEDIDVQRWRRWRRHFDETSEMRSRYQAIIRELAGYTGPEPAARRNPGRRPHIAYKGATDGSTFRKPQEKIGQRLR
jgi:hypothetical protein